MLAKSEGVRYDQSEKSVSGFGFGFGAAPVSGCVGKLDGAWLKKTEGNTRTMSNEG
jgi:hypothetical protein